MGGPNEPVGSCRRSNVKPGFDGKCSECGILTPVRTLWLRCDVWISPLLARPFVRPRAVVVVASSRGRRRAPTPRRHLDDHTL